MSKIDKPIKGIWGHEPMREGEYPSAFIVGSPCGDFLVTKVTFREDHYGDHGIGWFDVWSEETLIGSVNARAVSEVHYQT